MLAGGHRLEDRPDRHFGLAEADIATDQAVHRLGTLHIAFHFDDRLALIRRGFVWEGILQFALPGAIGGESEAGRLVALRIELDQIHRHPADGLLGPLLGFGPGDAAHAVQLRRLIAGGAVTAQAAELVGSDAQQAVGVLHHQVVAGFTADRQFFQLQEAADAVVAMHHEVPRQHLQRVHGAAGRPSPPSHIARRGEAVLAEELPVGEQHQLPSRQLQPFQLGGASGFERYRGVLLDQPLNRRSVAGVRHEAGDAVVFLQQGHGPRRLGREQPHPRFLRLKALDQAGQLAELVGMGRHRAAGQIEAVEVPVGFMQLGQVEAAEAFSLSQGLLGRAMQRTRQGRQLLLLEVVLGMVKPLLAVSQAMAALIDGHQTVVGQVIEQAGGPLPGQAHQPAHPLGCTALQQLLEGLGTQQLLQFSRHLLP